MSINIQVSIPNPGDHLFHVSIILDEIVQPNQPLDLSMPVWIPGSYLVREYARHVQNVHAHDATGHILEVEQIDKATWRVFPKDGDILVVQYEVYANDINVRANHMDDSHAFFNGVSLFMYPHGHLDHSVTLSIEHPEDWEIFTGLPRDEEIPNIFVARDYDELFDCPFEIGPHHPTTVDVRDRPHHLVFWGEPQVDKAQLAEDTAKIVEAHAELFGGLPYDDYTFITLLAPGGRGGLEHRNSTVLYWDALDFRNGGPGSELKENKPTGRYLDYLRLVCHEHFHTWNVKRIRPAVLGPFDYQNENYTRELWTVEGVTSYYEVLSLLRAEIMPGPDFLEVFAKSIQTLNAIPGRKLHSLEQASFNAWVKLYRPDENTRNSSVSYYLKGELVTFLLDVLIRARSGGQKNLDHVMQTLWADYKETGKGYPERGYDEVIQRATGIDLSKEINLYARTTAEIPWNDLLGELGLVLHQTHDGPIQPWLGVQTQAQGGRLLLKSVNTEGPAYAAGFNAKDELVAINGHQITSTNLSHVLSLFETNQSVNVHLFRRGQLIERQLTLAPAPPQTYTLTVRDDLTEAQHQILTDWLGTLPQPKTAS